MIIKRCPEPRAQIIEKEKNPNEPQLPEGKGSQQAGEGLLHFRQVDAALGFLIRNQPAKTTASGATAMIAAAACKAVLGRQPLNQLTADKPARQRRDVEPQPLLIDEGVAGAEPLAVFDEDCTAQCARHCHRIGRQQQDEDQLTGRGNLRDPTIRAGRGGVGEYQVGLTAVTEERQEIRNDPVDRLDDPGKVEDRQIGGDLDRGPPESLLQIEVERLGNQAAGLADSFDDIDQAKEQHEPADLPVPSSAGRRRTEGRGGRTCAII